MPNTPASALKTGIIKKLIIALGISIGVMVSLLVCLVLFLPKLVSTEGFKSFLENQASSALTRPLQIEALKWEWTDDNLIQPVSTFLSWWLNKNEAIPLNTNAIESAFSQVNNRIKRIGRRWSDKGLLNWLKVVFYKIFKPELWNLQWIDNKKPLIKIKLLNLEVAYHWSDAIT